MKSLIEIVKEKIIKNIPDCNIDIIDNTHWNQLKWEELLRIQPEIK